MTSLRLNLNLPRDNCRLCQDGRQYCGYCSQPAQSKGWLHERDSADKQARFIRFCDAFNIPIILPVDTPGYLPGKDQEYAGIIRHGAKVLYALSEATVQDGHPVKKGIRRGSFRYGDITRIRDGFGICLAHCRGRRHGEPNRPWPYSMQMRSRMLLILKLSGAQKIQEYRTHYADPMALASDVTYIHDIIEPRETRRTLIQSLRFIQNKKIDTVLKRHGNIPL